MSQHEGIHNDVMTSAIWAWFFIRHSDFGIHGARLLISLAAFAITRQ